MNIRDYLKKVIPSDMNKFSPVKGLFTNLLLALGARQITVGMLRKKMPESLRVILKARKRLLLELPAAVEKDTGINLGVIKEDVDLYNDDNDKNNYNEGFNFHGFMMTFPVIWFILVFLLIFGEETHRKIMDFLFEKGDRLLSRMGLNTFNDTDNKK